MLFRHSTKLASVSCRFTGRKSKNSITKMGLDVVYVNSADFAKQLQSDRENAKKIIEEIQKSGK